jgi:4-hydroxybenzoate polyprenyltransferase
VNGSLSESAAVGAPRPTVRDWLSLVRFSHSVFALPFALVALLAAAGGWPSVRLLVLVVLAMVAARTAAMGYNRLVDRDVDAENPRTKDREIPRGAVSPRQAGMLVLVSAAAFVLIAFLINTACGLMALPVLAVLLGYSHAKRFTSLAQLWLGFALGLSPLGAWVAVRGVLDASLGTPAVLTLGITCWVAGFDALYAVQDAAFDRERGLHSIVTWLGENGARLAALVLHAVALPAFWWFGDLASFDGGAWRVGLVVSAVMIATIHALALTGRFRRAGQAFFMANAGVPVVLLAACALEFVVR